MLTMRTSSLRNVGWSIWFGFATASLVGQVSYVNAQVPPPGIVGPAHSNIAPLPGVMFPPAPLPGFNPLTASDSELKVLGFPPKPDVNANPRAYAHWSKMVSASKTRIAPVVQQTNIYHAPPRNLRPATQGKPDNSPPLENSTLVSSTNWSGFADYQPNAPFLAVNSYVFAQWVVPIAQQAFGTCSGGWEYSSQWVGFDGVGSSDVLQAGSEADAYCNGSTNATFYALWYEWYPNPEMRISNFTISPGDVVGVEVWNAGGGAGGAYWINYTTQVSTSIGFYPPQGTVFAGTSIEWIVEAPTINGSTAALVNYTAIPWNNTYGYSPTTGSFYDPGYAPGGTAYDIQMISGTSSVISSCSSLFYMAWCLPSNSAL
jgi:hypothetical protein